MATTNDAGDTVRSVVSDAARAEQPATSRLRDQARVVAMDVQHLGGIVREMAQEKLGKLREGAVEYFGRARGKARQAEDGVGESIRHRPVTSVVIGVGLGLLFGRFWLRR